MSRHLILSILLILIFSCSGEKKANDTLILFAASGVTNVAKEISENFHKETGIKIRLNIASSGILARQIESGAEFDYFISANKSWMNHVDRLQLVQKNSIVNLASSHLVAIVPQTDQREFFEEDFKNNFPNLFKGRLSVGDPKHVPAGLYAMQAINSYGFSEALSNRILPAKNVRDALLMVELGEAEMGIVYETDAIKSDKVKIVHVFTESSHDQISYMGAAKISGTKNIEQFLLYLQSENAKSIWKKNGFKIQ
jgi:molybdate transport system substrate-binding protein